MNRDTSQDRRKYPLGPHTDQEIPLPTASNCRNTSQRTTTQEETDGRADDAAGRNVRRTADTSLADAEETETEHADDEKSDAANGLSKGTNKKQRGETKDTAGEARPIQAT